MSFTKKRRVQARPLPVNLLLAGTGGVLLVSGIGGATVGEVLQGSFGDITGKQQAALSSKGQAQNAALLSPSGSGFSGLPSGEGESESESQSSPSSSTFAPSPDTFHKHVSKQQELRSIAAILLSEGIVNPTHQQIQAARELYHRQ